MDNNARDKVLFLEIDDTSGVDVVRWQSYWRQTVTWESKTWDFESIEWSGVSSGVSISGQASFEVADLQSNRNLLLGSALDEKYGVIMRVYEWRKSLNLAAPTTADLVLTGTLYGEILSASVATFETISVTVGVALSRTSAFFPPNIADNALIGNPCILT